MTVTLRLRIIGAMIGVGALGAISVGGASYFAAAEIVERQTATQIDREIGAKIESFKRLEATVRSDLRLLTSPLFGSEAVQSFAEAFDDAKALQRAYIDANPHPTGSKHLLDAADQDGAYHTLHRRYHPQLRALLLDHAYYDIFLISQDGDLVYSVFKELDFATNLETGAYRDSGLAAVFRAARDAADGAAVFEDFAPYAPSAGAPAAFVGQAIRDASGRVLGVAAVQLPSDSRAASLADGAEMLAYAVGADGALRTDLAATEAADILSLAAPSDALAAWRGGEAAARRAAGVLGERSLIAARPIPFFGADWAIIAETPLRVAMAPVAALQWTLAAIVLGVLAAAFALAYFVGGGVSRAISDVVAAMRRVADGDLDTPIVGMARSDEIGAMAKALSVFRDNAARVTRLRAEREQAAERAAAARRHMMEELRGSVGAVVAAAVEGDFSQRASATFDDAELNDLAQSVNRLAESVEAGVGAVDHALERLAAGQVSARMEGAFKGVFAVLQSGVNETAESLEALIEELATAANRVHAGAAAIKSDAIDLSSRAENQASSLQETAATTEQMSSTIKASSHNAERASSLASEASAQAGAGGAVAARAVDAMAAIEESASRIEAIIGVIDGIAFQTNLLALNAAVEAARAGEAGKGFAVVATEVRTLAQRSADAARDIRALIAESSAQVSGGVELVREAGDALGGIVKSVTSVANMISEISGASREQAAGVEEIAAALAQMEQLTQSSAGTAVQSAEVAAALDADAQALEQLLSRFETARRAAA